MKKNRRSVTCFIMASAVSAMVLNGCGEEDSGRGRLSENAPAHATQPPTAPETTPTAAPAPVSGTYVSDVGSFLEAFCQEQCSISCKNHTKKGTDFTRFLQGHSPINLPR